MADLKPCPFCGSEKAVVFDRYLNEVRLYWAYCRGCKSQEPVKATEAEAIAAWNQRASVERDSEIERQLVLVRDRLKERLDNLIYIPRTEACGHPHGYSLLRIPDWEAKQIIDEIEAALKLPEPPKEGPRWPID